MPNEITTLRDSSFVYLTDSSTGQDPTAVKQDEISFSLSLEPDLEEDEGVLSRAKRLLLAEFDKVESKNQLVHYLKAGEVSKIITIFYN